MSNRWPAGSTPPSGGMIRREVAADAGAEASSQSMNRDLITAFPAE
jgi:hypothetical protein